MHDRTKTFCKGNSREQQMAGFMANGRLSHPPIPEVFHFKSDIHQALMTDRRRTQGEGFFNG